MGYRLDQTVNGDPDPMLSMARIGLLSNMELWLGIIVACIPTMAPFARTYIQPSLSKVFSKIYGSSSGPSKEGTPRVQLKTFGGSGGSGNNRSNYTELDEPSANLARDHDEMQLIGNGTSQVRTEIRHGSSPLEAPTKDGIHVQKQFQTYDEV